MLMILKGSMKSRNWSRYHVLLTLLGQCHLESYPKRAKLVKMINFARFYPAHACALALKSTWQLRWKQCYQFCAHICAQNLMGKKWGVFSKKIPQQSGHTVAELGTSQLRGQSKDKSWHLLGNSKPVKTQVSVTQDGNTLWFRSEKADFRSGFGHCGICFGSEEGF